VSTFDDRQPYTPPLDREKELMRRELAELQTAARALRRQLDKALTALTEAQRAHSKMVETLTETVRENTVLTGERDSWRLRALRSEGRLSNEYGPPPVQRVDISSLATQLSDEEVTAIRKAMARLHHPDVGGDPERMKAWNAALDRIGRE
jgi:chromosome segregation ATPase